MIRTGIFAYPRQDCLAGIVVFLVALPLCLGIAMASGVPPVSGLVAGIIGGIAIPLISRSALSVSGPAAGLIAIVLFEIERLGGINAFMTAVALAGAMQIVLRAFSLIWVSTESRQGQIRRRSFAFPFC